MCIHSRYGTELRRKGLNKAIYILFLRQTSFLGILSQGADIISGSKLEDDLMQVVKGIAGLQAASNLGTMDFTSKHCSIENCNINAI